VSKKKREGGEKECRYRTSKGGTRNLALLKESASSGHSRGKREDERKRLAAGFARKEVFGQVPHTIPLG